MKSFYYYSFYLLSMFSKRVNKRNSEYAFSGMACLSVLMWFNIYTLLLSPLRLFNIIKIKGSLFYIGIMLCVLVINYNLLIADNKSEGILNFYRERSAYKQNKGSIIGLCVYIIVSLVLFGYTAYLARNAKN
jgi:hypothetical protein